MKSQINIFTGLEGRKRKAAGLDAKINMIDCATGSLVQGKYVYSTVQKITFDFSKNSIRTPSGDFELVSEEF